jgi:hypothetical protein
VLNLRARITRSAPCERDVRGRLFSFYDWCAQNDDIPELVALARTVSRWEEEIVAAVLTGVSNASAESLNRIAKLEAHQAYSFRNPAIQRRRVRTACTRGRSRAPARTKRRSRLVPDGHLIPVNFEEPDIPVWNRSCPRHATRTADPGQRARSNTALRRWPPRGKAGHLQRRIRTNPQLANR